MPQVNYDHPSDLGLPGQRAHAYGAWMLDSFLLASQFATWTATVGGTAANGVYSFRVVDEESGVIEDVSFDRQDSETNNQIAAALAADGNANEELIPAVGFSVATNVVTVAARTAGRPLVLDSATAPGTGTLTLAQTVQPGGDSVAPGLAVVRVTGATHSVRLPTTGDAAAAIVGILYRSESTLEKNEGDIGQVNALPRRARVAVAREGALWVEPETSVTAGGRVHVRISGTGQAGALRGSSDGGNTVELANAEWVTDSVEFNGRLRAVVRLNRPQ